MLKYILPDGSITYSSERAKIEYLKQITEIPEGSIEFLPDLGMKSEFIDVNDMMFYLAKKFGFGVSDVKVEREIIDNKPYIKIYVYGTSVGTFEVNT